KFFIVIYPGILAASTLEAGAAEYKILHTYSRFAKESRHCIRMQCVERPIHRVLFFLAALQGSHVTLALIYAYVCKLLHITKRLTYFELVFSQAPGHTFCKSGCASGVQPLLNASGRYSYVPRSFFNHVLKSVCLQRREVVMNQTPW